ncbi:hypothetical protein EST38_g12743 [Candolleomyces aberdarensis]|uniref:Uncharacterized protein n=1 Tax=Candolleomyces aberdarensis TaxID=2316362 RepID=A0A4Q2D3Y2_9AGAR|nr:hypothetical protein EST38_g12743 [Candolleomyces aberdarensis]
MDMEIDDQQTHDSLVDVMDRDEDLEEVQNAYEADLSNLKEVEPSTSPDAMELEDVNAVVPEIISQMSKKVKDNTDEDYKR